jgi:hypothetical protein
MAGLYNYFTFSDGSIFTPDLADLAYEAPIFDDQPQYKGHRARILDSELSNTSGQIKDRVSVVTNNLKCSVGSGLVVTYTSGSVRLPSGALYAIAAGSITVTNNVTGYYVWVNSAGTIEQGQTPPVIRVLLAQYTTVSGSITALADIRGGAGYPDIRPVTASIRSFGGNNATDLTATSLDAVYGDGEYYFRNFTVPAGVSITVDKLAKFHCSGNVNIAGTINIAAWVLGGGGTAYKLNPGVLTSTGTVTSGAGSGGAVSVTATLGGSLVGGEAGSGFGGGSGEAAKSVYNHLVSPVGSGGGAGYITNNDTTPRQVNNNYGGNGGGCLWIEAAGSITVTGTINVNGSAGAAALDSTGVIFGGCGGGSGGLVLLRSLTSITLGSAGVINANGGAGGTGISTLASGGGTITAEPGSGGGGGRVLFFAPSITKSGTVNVNGGAVGGWQVNATARTNLALGGCGGSYGGEGGNQLPYEAGDAGVYQEKTFVPIG